MGKGHMRSEWASGSAEGWQDCGEGYPSEGERLKGLKAQTGTEGQGEGGQRKSAVPGGVVGHTQPVGHALN